MSAPAAPSAPGPEIEAARDLREELYLLIDRESAAIGRLVLSGTPAGDPHLGALRESQASIGNQIGEINLFLAALAAGELDPSVAQVQLGRLRNANEEFRRHVERLA